MMRNLLDLNGDRLKTEINIKKYLASINDRQLKNLYDSIELTQFPILLACEYRQRFRNKSKSV